MSDAPVHPRAEEVKPGEARLLMVNDQEVALFNVGGLFYAVGNRCPHRSGPLVKGRVETVSETGDPAIRCPIHGWLFDLKSGRCLTRTTARISTYPVFCEEGKVVLGPSCEGQR